MKGKFGPFGWLVLFLALGCTQSPSAAQLTPTPWTPTQSTLTTTTPTPAPSLPAATSPPLPSVTPKSNGYPPPATVELPPGYVAPPTATPTPTNTAGPSPTPWPTDTPQPTPTVATATSLPTVVPAIQPATIDHLPGLSRDLLFLEDGQLRLWDHAKGKIETLLGSPDEQTSSGSVTEFSMSNQGGNVAAVLTDAGAHKLVLLSLETRQVVTLVDETVPLLFMSISPDGQSVAYVPQDPPPDPALSPTPPATSTPAPNIAAEFMAGAGRPAVQPLAGDGPESGKVLVVSITAPNQPQEVGYCAEIAYAPHFLFRCRGIVWSPDSRSLLGADGHGIWLSDLTTPTRLLAANYVPVPETSDMFLYVPIAWSPIGRYVLLSVRYSEGSSRAILDTHNGQVAHVVDSRQYVGPYALITWMRDGRLFILRPRDALGNPVMTTETWHIDPALPELLSRDNEFGLNLAPNNFPAELVQLEDGRLAFAVLNENSIDYEGRGLYVLDMGADTPSKLIGLPPARDYVDHSFDAEISWAPDGSMAIVRHDDPEWLVYAAIDDGALYDLLPIVDARACCFTWIN